MREVSVVAQSTAASNNRSFPQDIGAEVAEQGSGEWRGPDSAHLDDTKAIQRSRHGEISWLKSENAVSAMEPDGVIDAGPPDARGIGLDGAVLVAERNTEQQPVICGNAEMFTDDFGKQPERALRAGGDAALTTLAVLSSDTYSVTD